DYCSGTNEQPCPGPRTERKLAVILAADVAGYSRLPPARAPASSSPSQPSGCRGCATPSPRRPPKLVGVAPAAPSRGAAAGWLSRGVEILAVDRDLDARRARVNADPALAADGLAAAVGVGEGAVLSAAIRVQRALDGAGHRH